MIRLVRKGQERAAAGCLNTTCDCTHIPSHSSRPRAAEADEPSTTCEKWYVCTVYVTTMTTTATTTTTTTTNTTTPSTITITTTTTTTATATTV